MARMLEVNWDDEEDKEEKPEQIWAKEAFSVDRASSKKPWYKHMVKDDTMDSSSIQQSLCHAARLGRLEEMKLLVSQGADVNLGEGEEDTPLIYAVKSRNLEAVEFLVRSGADVNLQEDEYYSPLMYAVKSGNLEAVKFLVRSGAHVNFSDGLLNPLLYHSTDSGNLAIIEFLISSGADVNPKSNEATPLHYAASFASVELVEYLVENGANVNARDWKRETPIYYAIRFRKFKNVVFLLDHGADMNAKDEDDVTPIHCALKIRNNYMHGFLKRSSVWERRDEVCGRSLETVMQLIDQGADLSAIDEEGKTPGHAVVHNQHLKIVEFLIRQRGELLTVDTWYPRYDAYYRGMAKIIRLLRDRGADVNTANKDGDTPLDLAKNELCRSYMNVLNASLPSGLFSMKT